jgi:hypothetical protein
VNPMRLAKWRAWTRIQDHIEEASEMAHRELADMVRRARERVNRSAGQHIRMVKR